MHHRGVEEEVTDPDLIQQMQLLMGNNRMIDHFHFLREQIAPRLAAETAGGGATFQMGVIGERRGEMLPVNWGDRRDPDLASRAVIGGHRNPATEMRHDTRYVNSNQFDEAQALDHLIYTATYHGHAGDAAAGTWLNAKKEDIDLDVSTPVQAGTRRQIKEALREAVNRGEEAIFHNNPGRDIYTKQAQYKLQLTKSGKERTGLRKKRIKPRGYKEWDKKHTANQAKKKAVADAREKAKRATGWVPPDER